MFIGKIIATLVGLIVTGDYIGVIVGFIVGAFYDFFHANVVLKQRKIEDFQHSFSVALTKLAVHVAKANGSVSSKERAVFFEGITASKNDKDVLHMLYDAARFDNENYLNYAEKIAEYTAVSPEKAFMVYKLLYEISCADGSFNKTQRGMLDKIASKLGISTSWKKKLEEDANKKKASFGGFYEKEEKIASATLNDDLYDILGLEKGVSTEEIKKAYRKKIREIHPDKLRGEGKSLKEIQKAEEEMALLNSYYSDL